MKGLSLQKGAIHQWTELCEWPSELYKAENNSAKTGKKISSLTLRESI